MVGVFQIKKLPQKPKFLLREAHRENVLSRGVILNSTISF